MDRPRVPSGCLHTTLAAREPPDIVSACVWLQEKVIFIVAGVVDREDAAPVVSLGRSLGSMPSAAIRSDSRSDASSAAANVGAVIDAAQLPFAKGSCAQQLVCQPHAHDPLMSFKAAGTVADSGAVVRMKSAFL